MSAELLVFPVGHDLGPYHPSAGQPAVRHEVRIGRTLARNSGSEYNTGRLHGAVVTLSDEQVVGHQFVVG